MAKVRYNINLTDISKENDGVWVTHADIPAVQIKVRRFRSKPVQAAFVVMQQKQSDTDTAEQSVEALRQLLIDAVLVDWKGIVGADDTEVVVDIPYSKEEAAYVLLDSDFADWVYQSSIGKENFAYADKNKLFEQVVNTAKKS